MLSRNGNLSTDQLLARLREGAVPFPTAVPGNSALVACHVPTSTTDFQSSECLCTTATCGAGMANAANSVVAADRPIAAIFPPASISAGQNVTLDANGSAAACNRTIASFAWVVTQPTANPPAITDANTATPTLVAPASGASSVTLTLTVTDDQGRSDTAEILLDSHSATTRAPATAGNTPCIAAITSGPTPAPGGATPTPTPTPPAPQPSSSSSSGGGKGGGGGSIELFTLGLLGLLARFSIRRRRSAHFSRCI